MVRFDRDVAEILLRYARRVVERGYVHNTLGNIAFRVPAPGFEGGVVYTKHAGVSLEEMTLDNVVITDVPTGRLLHGHVPTSVGHQLNREILRLRPDVNAVIHVHHDETIAYFAASPGREFRVLSIEFPSIMGRPPHVLPSHVNVELDVAPIKSFVDHTNAIIMEAHGVTTFGRSLSEAYHRLNTLAAEVRRHVVAEQLAALRGSQIQYVDAAALAWAYEHADDVVYPTPATATLP